MPPVVPRLSYAIVERHIEKYMDELQLDLSNVINKGVDAERSTGLRQKFTTRTKCILKKRKKILKNS